MDSFENINDHLVYTKVKLRSAAIAMREKAKEAVQEGKSVVIFFDEHYHSYLAPGHDPYQIRKEIDLFLNPPPSSEEGKGKTTANAPARDSKGKFVSRLKSAGQKAEPSKKKSFWGSLR